MIDLTITDCADVCIDSSGRLTFAVMGKTSETQVRFDLGQRVVIEKAEDGFLRVSVERAAGQEAVE